MENFFLSCANTDGGRRVCEELSKVFIKPLLIEAKDGLIKTKKLTVAQILATLKFFSLHRDAVEKLLHYGSDFISIKFSDDWKTVINIEVKTDAFC